MKRCLQNTCGCLAVDKVDVRVGRLKLTTLHVLWRLVLWLLLLMMVLVAVILCCQQWHTAATR